MNALRLLAVPPRGIAIPNNDPHLDDERPRSTDELSRVAHEFVGQFSWSASHSGRLLDFEHVDLRADGSYVAKVEATLLNPSVRSFGCSPCTLPEEGRWNAYKVSGQTRIRVRPTTSRARVYVATMVSGHLSLARRGQRTMLFLGDRLSLVERKGTDVITTCA